MFFCESLTKDFVETNSHFTIDNKVIYSIYAALSKNGGRPVGGIGFIIDNNIKCEVNTKLGDWVGTLTLGRLRIIGVYLQYEKDIEAENKFAHQQMSW